jgi:hypothetical protein
MRPSNFIYSKNLSYVRREIFFAASLFFFFYDCERILLSAFALTRANNKSI